MAYKDPEVRKQKDKERYQKNKDKILQRVKDDRKKNPEKYREYGKRAYQKNKKKHLEWGKMHYKKNKERYREWNRNWVKRNYRKRLEYNRMWIMNNPKQLLRKHIAGVVGYSLKTKYFKSVSYWEKLLGYTRQELMASLESQFQEGMSWDNYGEWHIDHIKPVSSFTVEQFKECWALDNLQPLWARDNLSKGAKILA